MKFVYAILVLLALVAAALFLVPPFLDWERFKPEIAERLEAIVGRPLAIDGAIAVSILPSPEIALADLRIANAPGAAVPDMARIKSLDLALALGPLLGGEIAVTSLALVEPVIELERFADGRAGWLIETAAGETPAQPAAGGPEAADLEPTRIDSATVRNGTIVYRHGDGRPPERIERIDAVLSARSLDGPFRADGSATLHGRAIAFQLATGTIGEDRALPLSLEASAGGERGTALFEGSVSGIDGTPAFDGTLRAQAADLGALLSALDIDPGALPPASLAGAFSAKGALSAHTGAVAARDLQLRLGESQASGALSWQGGDVPSFDAKIALDRIDLDRFLPAAGAPEAAPDAAPEVAPDAAGADGAGQAGGAAAAALLQTLPEDIRQTIPAETAATLDLSIGTLTWRAGVIRQARAHLALDDGALTIRQASALLPGGADVQLTGRLTQGGERPWLEGSADITAENLRAVLSWLDVEADAVPADRLRRLSASADLSARGDRIAASNLDLRIDTTRIAGDASFETGERPRLAARLALDAVNLDAYLRAADAPAAAAGGEAGDEAAAPPDPPPPPAPAAGGAGDDVRAALGGIDADVALKIDALTYGGVRFTGLELVSALEDGDATLHRAQVADAAGLSLSITGGARALWSAPTVALAVEGAAASLADLTALLKIDPAIRSEAFGAVALQGSLAGDREALAVDLAVDAGSAEASLTGTIETPFDTPAAALALRLRAADAAVLARTAGLTPPPVVARLGALAIDGRIGGDLDSVALDLHAESAGATLKLSGRIADPLSSPSYRLAVDLSHPRAEALLERVAGAAPAGAALGALHIVGSVSGDATAADIAGIDVALGASRVSGGVFLRLDREPPAFSADLRAGTLDLAWLGGGVPAAGAAPAPAADGSGTGPGAASGTGRWSDEAIDLGLLDRLDGTLSLDAEALILGAYRIEQATAELAAAEGTLTLKSLRGRLFDGALQADGSLSGGSVPAGQAAFRLSGADMGAILLEAAGVDAVSGSATLDGYVTVRGQTARAMVGSLAGRVTLASRGGAVEDVDLPAISRQIGALAELDSIDDIPSFIAQAEQSLSSGRTAIRSLDGTVRVQDGQARIDDVTIVADGAAGTVSGSADLPAWQADLTASFRLVEHPDAPPVGVRLEGPIDRPRRRYLIEDMQAHLVRLGLLSLARAQELPTITIRKGAKAEPGTGMDRLLRNVFGDPEEADGTVEAGADGADDVEDAADGDVDADADPATLPPLDLPAEPADAGDPPQEEAAGGEGADETEPPAGGEGTEEAADAANDAGDAEGVEEPGVTEPPEETTDTEATDGEGEGAVPPPADALAPRPPPAPEREPGADFQDFLNDMLRSLDQE